MNKRSVLYPQSVPPERYTRDYFERWCDGADEFRASGGLVLPQRLRIPLEVANVQPGQRVLDIGCGRGEIVLHCAQRGAFVWGIDYAIVAIRLAVEALIRDDKDISHRIVLLQADARAAIRG